MSNWGSENTIKGIVVAIGNVQQICCTDAVSESRPFESQNHNYTKVVRKLDEGELSQ